MTKLSIVASRVLVGFGVIAFASASSFAANIDNTAAGTDKSFTQSGSNYTWNGKDNTGADVAQGNAVDLTLSDSETASVGTPPNAKEVSSFNSNPNSSVKINLQQDPDTALVAGDKLTILGDSSATDEPTLYNFDLNAGVIDIGNGTDLVILEANNGESKLGTLEGQQATFKDKSNLVLKNNGSVSATSDVEFESGSELHFEGSGSLKVGGNLTMTGNGTDANIVFTNPKNVSPMSVAGDVAFTNSKIDLKSKSLNQLNFDAPKTLLTGGTDTATIAGVTLTKDTAGKFNTTATAATGLSINAATLEKTAGDWLGRSISSEIADAITTPTDINLSGSDTTAGANNAATGFVDYTNANKVLYQYDANGDPIKLSYFQDAEGKLKALSAAEGTYTTRVINNGLYIEGNALKLGSYLTKNEVNGKWVANINNMNKIITAAGTTISDIKNELSASNPNPGTGAAQAAANSLIAGNAGAGILKNLDDERVTAIGNRGTLETNVNTAQAALDALPENATDLQKETAQNALDLAKTAQKDNESRISELASLINEGKALWNNANAKTEAYAKLADTNADGTLKYFKQDTINNTKVDNETKLNRAGINLLADAANVSSHKGLAVSIFDSLQESGLSEWARGDIMTDMVWNGAQRLKGLTNDTHDIGRSATNFTNSVSTAINVSNDLALGDRIARAHNPYGEKLAAVGSDAYHDFYRNTNGSVWVNAFGGANIVDGESGGVYGISLGADKQVSDSALIGVYFTYADADLKDKTLKQESDNFRLGIYSNIQIAQDWELNIHGFGQLAQTDQYASKLGERYSSDFDKKFFGLSGSVGKIISFENSLFLKPFVGLNYYYSHAPSYTEKGGSFNVKTNKMQNNSLSADVGLELRKYFNETSYLFATPKIEQYLVNNGDDYVSSFVGSPINFSVSASDKLKTYGQLIVGGSFGVADNLNIELGLGAKQILTNKVDNKNETYLSGNLGLRYKF